MRTTIGILTATIVNLIAQFAFAASPNIVFIYTDDQGAWTTRDAHPNLKTPNIDRIGREGAVLNNCFAATPVCSPARASIMSSRYGTEVGVTDWINHKAEPDVGLDTSNIIWPKVLADAGYDTALLGKWHLGTQDRFHPTRFGFKTFYGFLEGGTTPRDPVLEVDGKNQKVAGLLTDILSDRAVKYIREKREKPFLLCLHHRSPHSPYTPVADEVWDRFKDLDPVMPVYPDLAVDRMKGPMREYLSSVADIDRTLGRILQAIDDAGLRDNTVVIYSSDQGYNVGQHGIWHKGNAMWATNSKWPTGKGARTPRSNIFDTSLRVPALIRWPAAIKPGTIVNNTIGGVDFYPTLCAMAGTKPPAGQTIRGHSFLPLLRGEKIDWNDELFAQYSQHHYTTNHMRMWRTPKYKLMKDFLNPGKDELYDLSTDPDENKNLIASTDPAVQQAKVQLEAKLLAKMREINDPVLKSSTTAPGSGLSK